VKIPTKIKGLRFILTLYKFLKEVKKIKPDIIISKMVSPSGTVGVMYKKKTNVPVITQCEGGDIICDNGLWDKIINKFVLKRSNRVISATYDMKEIIEKKYGTVNTIIIKNGINFSKFNKTKKINLNLSRPVITFAARIEENKGLEYLLSAFKKINIEIKSANLLVLGEGSLRKSLEKKYMDKNIFFKGHINYEEMPEILKSSDLFVLPAIFEAQGISLLEAMSCGLPIISTKVGGIPELIKKDNGILVKPGNVNSLSNAMIKILKNERLREIIIKNNLKKAREHDWKIISREYVKQLEREM